LCFELLSTDHVTLYGIPGCGSPFLTGPVPDCTHPTLYPLTGPAPHCTQPSNPFKAPWPNCTALNPLHTSLGPRPDCSQNIATIRCCPRDVASVVLGAAHDPIAAWSSPSAAAAPSRQHGNMACRPPAVRDALHTGTPPPTWPRAPCRLSSRPGSPVT
jgi:hypothetical protein